MTAAGLLLRRAAWPFGVWLAACLVLVLFGQRPHAGLLALAVTAGWLTLILLLEADTLTAAHRWQLPGRDAVREPGEDPRLALLERVVNAHLVSQQVDDRLRRRLAEIADRRLVARHGISRLADPHRAAELIGPELTRFIGSPDARIRLTPSQIDALIDRIEKL